MIPQTELEQAIVAQIREVMPSQFKTTVITSETRLQRDLGLDSLAIAALLFRLEGELGLDLFGDPELPTRMSNLRSVGDLVAFAASLLR